MDSRFRTLLSDENHRLNDQGEESRNAVRFEFGETRLHCRPGVGRDPDKDTARRARLVLDSSLRRSDEGGCHIFPERQCALEKMTPEGDGA